MSDYVLILGFAFIVGWILGAMLGSYIAHNSWKVVNTNRKKSNIMSENLLALDTEQYVTKKIADELAGALLNILIRDDEYHLKDDRPQCLDDGWMQSDELERLLEDARTALAEFEKVKNVP